MPELNQGEQPTLGEIWRSLQRIERALGPDGVVGDHERRIRKTEKWMYAVPLTVVLAIGSVVSAVAGAK